MEGQTGIGVSAASESLVMKGLYGGAVQMGIPARFKDVSLARPVPDYQEVWADYEADQCVVVEMLEQSEIEDGKEALRDYFAKQMDHNNTKAGSVGLVEEINLPIFKEDPENPHVKGAWTGVLVGSQAISKGREAAMNEVRLMMTLVRLPEHSVDIVVIFNDPTMVSGDSSAAQTMEMFIKDGEGNMIVSATAVDAMPLFGLYNAMITSLRVADWGLFGG